MKTIKLFFFTNKADVFSSCCFLLHSLQSFTFRVEFSSPLSTYFFLVRKQPAASLLTDRLCSQWHAPTQRWHALGSETVTLPERTGSKPRTSFKRKDNFCSNRFFSFLYTIYMAVSAKNQAYWLTKKLSWWCVFRNDCMGVKLPSAPLCNCKLVNGESCTRLWFPGYACDVSYPAPCLMRTPSSHTFSLQCVVLHCCAVINIKRWYCS